MAATYLAGRQHAVAQRSPDDNCAHNELARPYSRLIGGRQSPVSCLVRLWLELWLGAYLATPLAGTRPGCATFFNLISIHFIWLNLCVNFVERSHTHTHNFDTQPTKRILTVVAYESRLAAPIMCALAALYPTRPLAQCVGPLGRAR